jgi:endonuclease YncB( thermonuclease family)
LLTKKDISLGDFEKKMVADGWQKRTMKSNSSWQYFYRKYVRTGKMEYSGLFHSDAPEVFWVKSIRD